jgi:zinc D-Ala-D-Ala carboxypeptidase
MTDSKRKRNNNFVIILLIISLAIFVYVMSNRSDSNNLKENSTNQGASLNLKQFSLSDAKSKWAIINKRRQIIPIDYVPNNLVVPSVALKNPSNTSEVKLRDDAAQALGELFAKAKKESINLTLISGYRSYDLQAVVYESFVKTQGKQTADTQSARPGHSEHQLGLAADIAPSNGTCELEICFAETPEGKWLAKNAPSFGYVIRYDKNQQDIVGYQFEPWHIRYVGKELAQKVLRNNNIPLELLFNLPPAPDYKR